MSPTRHQIKSAMIDLPSTGFVRLPTILHIYPVGRSTWWAGVKSGKFPAPVKLGPRTTAWRVDDIRALFSKGIGAELGPGSRGGSNER